MGNRWILESLDCVILVFGMLENGLGSSDVLDSCFEAVRVALDSCFGAGLGALTVAHRFKPHCQSPELFFMAEIVAKGWRCFHVLSSRTYYDLPVPWDNKHQQVAGQPVSCSYVYSPWPPCSVMLSLAAFHMVVKFVLGQEEKGGPEIRPNPRWTKAKLKFIQRRYHSHIKMLIKLMRGAQRCQYNRLLDKHCPLRPLLYDTNKDFVALPKDNQTTTTLHVIGDVWSAGYHSRSENGMKIEESIGGHTSLNKSYCSNHEVVSFIWAVCRNIVPPPHLGSPSTWRILQRNIYRFIELRQFEKFYLNQCLNRLKPCRFPLLSDMYSFCSVSGHVENDIIQPAKSQHGEQNLFYYRKKVWKDLISKACTGEKDETYHTLDYKSVEGILAKRPFGLSKVGLCPKSSGARVIANLKASSRIPHVGSKSFPKARKVSRMKSVNFILGDLLVVLKDFRKIEPEKWGSLVFDYDDIYKKLQSFLLNLKKESNIPDVFIASADVHKAFDTINQDKPLAVINETLTKDEYVLQRTNEISWSKKSLFAYKNQNQNQNLVGPRVHDVGVSDARPPHPLRPPHAIIMSEERGRTIRKEELQLLLTEHVKRNVLIQDDVMLEQAHLINMSQPKISTGTAFSSPKWTLLRLIDDFLFISTSKELSTSFFSRMRWGFQEYNCYMNEHKFCYSFGVGCASSKMHYQAAKERGRTIRKEELQLLLTEHVKRNVLRINKLFLLQLVGIPQGSALSSNLCSLYLGHLERNILFPFLDEVCASVMLEQAHTINMSQPKNSTGTAFSSPKWTLLRLIDDFLFISTSKELSTSFFSRMQSGFQEYNCYMNEHKFCYSFGVRLKQDALPGSKGLNIDGISYIQWSGLLINSTTLEVQADYTRYLNNHLRSTHSVCWQVVKGVQASTKILLAHYRELLEIYVDAHEETDEAIKSHTLFAHIEKKEIHWLGLTAYVRSLTKKQSRHKALLRLLRSKLAALGDLGTSPEMQDAVDNAHWKWLWKIKY
ncbi:Telomerase reverse transcriptase-like protein [Drosera capensis]